MLRPLREGGFIGVTYHKWEKSFLTLLLSICVLQMIATLDDRLSTALVSASMSLYLLPTVVILVACTVIQCGSKTGGFGRIRHLSVAYWRRQRELRERNDGRDAAEVNEQALEDMASGLREPLMVDQFRENPNFIR